MILLSRSSFPILLTYSKLDKFLNVKRAPFCRKVPFLFLLSFLSQAIQGPGKINKQFSSSAYFQPLSGPIERINVNMFN